MSNAIHAITMPKWGIEMTEGTITGWSVREGQPVRKGQEMLSVETEKIVNTVEAPKDGTVRRILAAEGDVRPVGSLIAVFADAEVSDAAIDSFVGSFKGATVSFEPDSPAASESSPPVSAEDGEAGDVRVSPIARRLAERLGVDLSKIKGTGRNGRISKEDIEAFATRSTTAPASGAEPSDNAGTRVKMSPMRATIARRLLESQQAIPHYRLTIDVDAGKLLKRKSELCAQAGSKITVNDLLVRACALALTKHPQVNAQLDGDEVVQFPHADIAIAIATANGLMAPIVRSADTKSAAEIARETATLGGLATNSQLTREQITGGTFTISNLGMYGLASFDAIINPPQVAILAVGAAQERVVARNGTAVVASVMTLTLSADHRVIDGAVGAAFLATLKELVEGADFL
jgi:pyruvate dehydrogenase E2 component (dihydrolipoamide acetyltransferase)